MVGSVAAGSEDVSSDSHQLPALQVCRDVAVLRHVLGILLLVELLAGMMETESAEATSPATPGYFDNRFFR